MGVDSYTTGLFEKSQKNENVSSQREGISYVMDSGEGVSLPPVADTTTPSTSPIDCTHFLNNSTCPVEKEAGNMSFPSFLNLNETCAIGEETEGYYEKIKNLFDGAIKNSMATINSTMETVQNYPVTSALAAVTVAGGMYSMYSWLKGNKDKQITQRITQRITQGTPQRPPEIIQEITHEIPEGVTINQEIIQDVTPEKIMEMTGWNQETLQKIPEPNYTLIMKAATIYQNKDNRRKALWTGGCFSEWLATHSITEFQGIDGDGLRELIKPMTKYVKLAIKDGVTATMDQKTYRTYCDFNETQRETMSNAITQERLESIQKSDEQDKEWAKIVSEIEEMDQCSSPSRSPIRSMVL